MAELISMSDFASYSGKNKEIKQRIIKILADAGIDARFTDPPLSIIVKEKNGEEVAYSTSLIVERINTLIEAGITDE